MAEYRDYIVTGERPNGDIVYTQTTRVPDEEPRMREARVDTWERFRQNFPKAWNATGEWSDTYTLERRDR